MTEVRYWRFTPAPAPGDAVAVHDGGVGLDSSESGGSAPMASGPGNYTVIVRRPGSDLPTWPVSERWPIELSPVGLTASSAPFRMNAGMARWFGLRLIEAAAICEAMDVRGSATPSVAPYEIAKLADFIQERMPDSIGEGSAVDNAIRMLTESITPPAPTDPQWREKDRKDFVETLNRLVQPDTQLWHTAQELFDEGAPVECVTYGLERTLSHRQLSHQTPAYLRGVVAERVRRVNAVLNANAQPAVTEED